MGPGFRVVSKLGEGSFAEVFKVKTDHGNQFYAVKRLKKRYNCVEDVHKLPEVIALQQLQGHPNVITLVDLIYDSKNGYVAMVFELMDCNVFELLPEDKAPFDERTSLMLSYQLLSAIAFMHSKHLFHRDVKPENCMVMRDTMLLKLADFGSTRGLSSSAPYTEYVSTRWYRAPECILTSGSYGPEVDQWAVGCMIYEFLTARPLFPGKCEVDQIRRIHQMLGTPATDLLAQFSRNPNTQIGLRFVQCPPRDFRTILPGNVSDEAVDLILRLLTYNPHDRISAADALRHPAFAEIRESEQQWKRTDMTVPLSAFFLFPERFTAVAVEPPRPLVPPVRVKPPKPLAAPSKPLIVRPIPVNPKQPADSHAKVKGGKEWQRRQVKPIPQPAHAPIYRMARPAVDKSYQKPGPDLLGAIHTTMLM
jgi:renal tumor antigen